jgi:hypothetical protein
VNGDGRGDMAKAAPINSFVGRWQITHMDEWDQEFVNAEGQCYFEWTFDGNDEMDPTQGRVWAVLKNDELHGMIFFHQSDESGFVAKKANPKIRKKPG